MIIQFIFSQKINYTFERIQYIKAKMYCFLFKVHINVSCHNAVVPDHVFPQLIILCVTFCDEYSVRMCHVTKVQHETNILANMKFGNSLTACITGHSGDYSLLPNAPLLQDSNINFLELQLSLKSYMFPWVWKSLENRENLS